MASTKHYGIIGDIAKDEPDAVTGSLSVAGIHADSVHSVASMVVVGSPSNSRANLAQFVLTAEQALRLGELLFAAGCEARAADREVENLRKYGAAAARLCFALAEADMHDVLVDQGRIRLGYPIEAQLIAERAYDRAYNNGLADGDWRAHWRKAGERLRKECGANG